MPPNDKSNSLTNEERQFILNLLALIDDEKIRADFIIKIVQTIMQIMVNINNSTE